MTIVAIVEIYQIQSLNLLQQGNITLTGVALLRDYQQVQEILMICFVAVSKQRPVTEFYGAALSYYLCYSTTGQI
jgi:hypothetical protein